MHTASASEWAQAWGPFVSLIANIALVAVTAWYVLLTRTMARSAQASAEQSRIAAEATQASVAVAESSLDVRFEVQPSFGSRVSDLEASLKELQAEGLAGDTVVTPDLLARIMVWNRVELTCLGATVTVHGLRLTSIGVVKSDIGDKIKVVEGTSYPEGFQLEADGETLPHLCHAGESIGFLVTDRPLNERLSEIQTKVLYSIGNSPVRERDACWTAPHHESSTQDSSSAR